MAKLDNRKVLGLVFLLALAGSLLLGDWQSIGHDPCTANTTSHTTHSDSSPSVESIAGSGFNLTGEAGEFLSLMEAPLSSRETCEDQSNDCFWNPQSRITGESCNTCFPACLSVHKSLCFYQFSLGVLLLAIATPLLFVFTSIISSDIIPVGSQVIYTLIHTYNNTQTTIYLNFLLCYCYDSGLLFIYITIYRALC